MFNVGGGEIVVILILALIVLGPDKLPSAARQAGKYLSEFRRISDGFKSELRDAMDFDDVKPRSGTMAPAKQVQVAPDATDATAAERDADGRPVGEAHRVVETANGPTLPPVMTPTTTPAPSTTTTTTPSGATGPSPTAIPARGTTIDPATGNAVEVDGPSASFG